MEASGSDTRQIERLERQVRERLAARLDALRRQHDYTLNFLADAAQIGRGHLSGIFGTKANVTLTTLVKLAYALDVDVADLLQPGATGSPSMVRGRPRTRRARR
jgi:transcriptional regulator with XRE-family HTH domain